MDGLLSRKLEIGLEVVVDARELLELSPIGGDPVHVARVRALVDGEYVSADGGSVLPTRDRMVTTRELREGFGPDLHFEQLTPDAGVGREIDTGAVLRPMGAADFVGHVR